MTTYERYEDALVSLSRLNTALSIENEALRKALRDALLCTDEDYDISPWRDDARKLVGKVDLS